MDVITVSVSVVPPFDLHPGSGARRVPLLDLLQRRLFSPNSVSYSPSLTLSLSRSHTILVCECEAEDMRREGERNECSSGSVS